jgi:AraC-like DNA-binding protein
MAHLRSRMLYRSGIVRVEDVLCHAPRSGRGHDELSVVPQVVLPRRGVFVMHRRGHELVADTNTAVVLGANDEYAVSHPVDGGDDCTALAFAPELLEQALGSVHGREGGIRPSTQLGAWVFTSALAPRDSPLDRLEIDEAALRLLDGLSCDLVAQVGRGAARGRVQRQRVEDTRALLAAAPTSRWRLEEVAAAVHSSPFHLARQFRAVTGESISRYLLRLRLGLALERIAGGERRLARLALDLGFAHHSHFSARFRETFGITPVAAREAITAPRLAEFRTIVTAGEPASA